MIVRVRALIAVQFSIACAAIAATIVLSVTPFGLAGPRWAVLAVIGSALALSALQWLEPVHVEVRDQNLWIAPTDGVYALVLVLVGPVGAVLTVALAEIVNRFRAANDALKHLYNVVSMTGGAAVAALVFVLLGGGSLDEPQTLLAIALALVTLAAWDLVMSVIVFRITTGDPWRSVAVPISVAQTVSLLVSMPVGLIAVILLDRSLVTLLLLVPILLLIHAAATSALRQRAERQRLQHLARSSEALVALADPEDALRRIAEQARELMAAVASVAVTVRSNGDRVAAISDQAGSRRLDTGAAEATLTLAHTQRSRSSRTADVASDTLPPDLLSALPASTSAIWADTREADGRQLIVLAVRAQMPDGGDVHRRDVLATFVAQAAVVLENSELHDTLRAALEQERIVHERRDQFIAAVSHELLTPLTAIGGAVETVRHRGEVISPAARAELLDRAAANTERLRARIEDLLLVATRDRTPDPDSASLIHTGALVDEVVETLRPWADDHLEVRGHLQTTAWCSDRRALHQILFHLLDNARKFAGPGRVVLAIDADDQDTRFTISDHGPGIADVDRERLFEPFVQGDGSSTRPQGGLGLGLALCRQLATTLEMRLDIDPDRRDGTTFVLTMPQHVPADS